MDDDSILQQSIDGNHLTEEEKRSVRDGVRSLCIDLETQIRAKMRERELTIEQSNAALGILAKIDRLREAASALEQLA